jgi:hypothetical protein
MTKQPPPPAPPDSGEIPGPRAKESPKRSRLGFMERVPGGAAFAATMPTNGQDLAAAWDLPPEAYRGGRLKIQRKKNLSNEMELIGESSVLEYSLASIAREYGPNDYYLQLSADPGKLWKLKHCKVSVAPEYARLQGFASYEEEPRRAELRIRDARALQGLADGMKESRPLDVGSLAELVSMVAEQTAKAVAKEMKDARPLQVGGDPMQFMGAVFQLQEQMENRAVRMLAALRDGPAEKETVEPNFWDSMIKVAGPIVAGLANRIPAAQPPPSQPEAPPMIDVHMTQEEAKAFEGAVAMLKPFVGSILQMMAASPDRAALAAELLAWIPERLEPQLKALDAMVQERGPAVLGIISAQLATPDGAALIKQIVSTLAES